MDTKLVNLAVNDLKEKMGDSLTYMSLVSRSTGQNIVGVNVDPRQDVQILKALEILRQGLPLNHYVMMHTHSGVVNMIIFDAYVLLVKYDESKMSDGMYMTGIMPNVIRDFEAALA